MGVRSSMGLMGEFAGAFKKKLAAAVAASSKDNLKPLEDLLADQRSERSKVNVKPYSEPEDRYEDMANDYGSFLYDHYGTACAMVQTEIDKLKQL